jgi:hypothetical protein
VNQGIVFKKGITRLCHFTKSSNLPYILGTGDEEANGIISNKAIRDSECKFLKLNDIHRYDNRPELICLSVEYPNFFFFEKSIEKEKESLLNDWVVLLISPSIINEETYFCPVNAAKNRGAHIGKGSRKFMELFNTEVLGLNRSVSMLPNIPTNNQAEVLSPDMIPKDKIIGLVFSSKKQARNEVLRLKLCQIELRNLKIYYSHEWFKRNSAYSIMQGKVLKLYELEE